MPMRRERLLAILKRWWNHRLMALSGWNFSRRQANSTRSARARLLPALLNHAMEVRGGVVQVKRSRGRDPPGAKYRHAKLFAKRAVAAGREKVRDRVNIDHG